MVDIPLIGGVAPHLGMGSQTQKCGVYFTNGIESGWLVDQTTPVTNFHSLEPATLSKTLPSKGLNWEITHVQIKVWMVVLYILGYFMFF